MSEQEQSRLESWKEIGAYLQRDARTVRRWEKEEGLPVHRHGHRRGSSVYAYPSEIDAWRAGRKVAAEPAPVRVFWRWPALAATMLLCLVMVGNGVRPVAAEQSRPMVKRLVCTDCGNNPEPDLTRDGKSMVFVDWKKGDIGVRDLTTGKVQMLLAKPPTSTDKREFAETPNISPDGRLVVFEWLQPNHVMQIRVMPNLPGAQSRVLLDNPEHDDYTAGTWFPDGKSIVMGMGKPDKTWELARVSLTDGKVTVLKSLGWRVSYGILDRPQLSPDGRYVAYTALANNPNQPPPKEFVAQIPQNAPRDEHIYVLAVDGSGESEIVKTSGLNRNPVWAPDGKQVLFTSDRSGSTDLWSVPVINGKLAGNPSLVNAGIGDIRTVGMYGGSYFYTSTRLWTYLNIGDLPRDGNPRQGPSNVTKLVGMSGAWSPDGKSLAFKRLHPGGGSGPDGRRYDLVVYSLDTGNERTYSTPLGTIGGGAPYWFQDGKSVLTWITRGGGSSVPYRIDLESGQFLDHWPPTHEKRYGIQGFSAPFQIESIDLDTGEQKAAFLLPLAGGITRIALSPDDRTIAISWWNGNMLHVARVAVDGTGFRELYTVDLLRPAGSGLGWSADGRSIVFYQQPSHRPSGIMRIPAEGGAPTLWWETRMNGLFILSPSGERYALQESDNAGELWALDNVASVLK